VEAVATRRRPNVVIMMADQQKATSLPLYGNPDTRTPHLDALATRGVWAPRYFVAHPFCHPSRCSLFTGRYPHAHGVRFNGTGLPAQERPLAEMLRDAGYRTGVVGHFHRKQGGARGFDFSREMLEGRPLAARRVHNHLVEAAPRRVQHMTATVPLAPNDDIDGTITSDALDFLGDVDGSAPFFLEVCWHAPHPPYFAPAPYDAMYDPAALRYPEPDPPDANKPPSHRRTAEDMGTWHAPEAEVRRALAFYYGMVSYVDDQVGRVLGYLERRGLLDDTIVVYTADHGDYAGEHGMFGKSGTLYDCLVRVPFIMAAPEDLVPRGAALDGIVQSVDVVPTLLDLLELPLPANVHGLSVRPLWAGACPADRPMSGAGAGRNGFDIAFAEVGAWPPEQVYSARGDNVPHGPPASGRQTEISAMARTAEWKLVYTPGREVQELYDLKNDPSERRNRYGEPGTEAVVRAMRDRIQDWMMTHT
jgi:arylsulfatase A-like enzyme